MSCKSKGKQCAHAQQGPSGVPTGAMNPAGQKQCPECAGWLRADGGCTKCDNRPPDGELDETASATIATLNKAIKADERQPFVIIPGRSDYIRCQTPEQAIRTARDGNGVAYVYEQDHHPANDPRSPIAAFIDGTLRMCQQEWRTTIDKVNQTDLVVSATSLFLNQAEQYQEMERDIPTYGVGALDDLDTATKNIDPYALEPSAAPIVRQSQALMETADQYGEMGRALPQFELRGLREAFSALNRTLPIATRQYPE